MPHATCYMPQRVPLARRLRPPAYAADCASTLAVQIFAAGIIKFTFRWSRKRSGPILRPLAATQPLTEATTWHSGWGGKTRRAALAGPYCNCVTNTRPTVPRSCTLPGKKNTHIQAAFAVLLLFVCPKRVSCNLIECVASCSASTIFLVDLPPIFAFSFFSFAISKMFAKFDYDLA